MDTDNLQHSNDIPMYYFGYGANRSKQCMEDISGSSMKDGRGAVLQDYALCYQVLEQVPEPPREILRKVWGDTFRCYTIRPFPKALVAGVVWELTPHQFHRIKEWEYDGSWKNIIQTDVLLFNGELLSVWTDMVIQSIPISDAVDGLYYQNNLNPHGKIPGIEDEFRIQALMRARQELQSFEFLSVKN